MPKAGEAGPSGLAKRKRDHLESESEDSSSSASSSSEALKLLGSLLKKKKGQSILRTVSWYCACDFNARSGKGLSRSSHGLITASRLNGLKRLHVLENTTEARFDKSLPSARFETTSRARFLAMLQKDVENQFRPYALFFRQGKTQEEKTRQCSPCRTSGAFEGRHTRQ